MSDDPRAAPAVETLGQRLRLARQARGLTQARLAELARVEQATISRLETSERQRADDATVARLADALGLDGAWLRDGTGTPPPEVVGEAAREPLARRFEALDHLLDTAFTPGRHRATDVAYLRHLLLNEATSFIARAPLGDYTGAVRYWLDAVGRLRQAHQAVTLMPVLLDAAHAMARALEAAPELPGAGAGDADESRAAPRAHAKRRR